MGGVCPPNPPLGDEAPPPDPLRRGVTDGLKSVSLGPRLDDEVLRLVQELSRLAREVLRLVTKVLRLEREVLNLALEPQNLPIEMPKLNRKALKLNGPAQRVTHRLRRGSGGDASSPSGGFGGQTPPISGFSPSHDFPKIVLSQHHPPF